MDIQRTKEYYDLLPDDDLCSCSYCKNYRERIKQAYPDLVEGLASLGIDASKPFETMPLYPDGDGTILYLGPQYVVMGDSFEPVSFGTYRLTRAESHPPIETKEPHVVVELSSLRLPYSD